MKSQEIFKCESCSKTFLRKFSLKRHVKAIHLREKDFKCECGKNFISRDQLKRHVISKHTQERPYKCEKGCEKSYATKMARNYHYRTFHENKKFVCSYLGCGREFASLRNLRVHNAKPHEFSMKQLLEKLSKKQKKIQRLKEKIDCLRKQLKDSEQRHVNT